MAAPRPPSSPHQPFIHRVPLPNKRAPPCSYPINIQQPTHIAHFSNDIDGRFHLDKSSLSQWHPPPGNIVPTYHVTDPAQLFQPLFDAPQIRVEDKPLLDLNSEFDQFDLAQCSGIQPLDGLLAALSENPIWAQSGTMSGISLITWRGILTKFLVAPFVNDRDGWELGLVRHKSTMYIHEHTTQARMDDDIKMSSNLQRKKMVYWGYRYEHLFTLPCAPSNDIQAAELDRVKTALTPRQQFCSIIKTKIGQHRIIIGAEMDCVNESSNMEYMELKTHRIGKPKNVYGWHQKLLRTWAQCYLAGVPKIVFGYRDDDGVLVAVQHVETRFLPKAVIPTKAWDPSVCIQFASELLHRLANITKNCPEGTRFVVRYDPKVDYKAIQIINMQDHGTEPMNDLGCASNLSSVSVLPDWFRNGDKPPSELTR